MDTLLVSGATVAGLLIGGALDPFGQRLADRSRLEDEERRAVAAAAEAADEAAADGEARAEGEPLLTRAAADGEARAEGADGAAAADGHPTAHAHVSATEHVPDETDRPAPPEGTVRNLLPSGSSPARTAGAAVVTAILFGGAADHFGRDLLLAPFCVFFAMLVAVSVTDLSHRLVPRRLLYPALVLIIPLLVAASAVDHRWRDLSGSAIAGAVAFGLFFAVWWFIPRGMGFGDVRLAGVIGITIGYLSLLHAYVAFLSGFIVGMLFGVVMMVDLVDGTQDEDPLRPLPGHRCGHRRLLGWSHRPDPVPRRILTSCRPE